MKPFLIKLAIHNPLLEDELKKAIDQTNFDYDEIKSLFSFQSGRWDIETRSGLLIRLPEKKQIDIGIG